MPYPSALLFLFQTSGFATDRVRYSAECATDGPNVVARGSMNAWTAWRGAVRR